MTKKGHVNGIHTSWIEILFRKGWKKFSVMLSHMWDFLKMLLYFYKLDEILI